MHVHRYEDTKEHVFALLADTLDGMRHLLAAGDPETVAALRTATAPIFANCAAQLIILDDENGQYASYMFLATTPVS